MFKWMTLFILTSVSLGWAEEGTTGPNSDPNLADLQTQMQQMQEQHTREIQALRDQIAQVSQAKDEDKTLDEQAELLRQLALDAAGGEVETQETPAEQVKFEFKGLNLSKLNPEISVSGDMVASFTNQDEVRKTTDINMRAWELNIQSYLDPFSKFKSTIPVDTDGNVEIEEMYFTRYNALGDISIDLGKFRQPFGVINRWHGDAIDQINYPLPIKYILGDDGLAQTGMSVDLPLPGLGDATQIVTVQVTNSENEHLFGSDTMGNPAMLFHYKNFRDLDDSSYFEFGLSGLFGWNDTWDIDSTGNGVMDTSEQDALGTQVFGADFTLMWEPVETAMYRNLEWRSEFFLLNRDIYAPDNSGRDSLDAWGAFSYVQTKVDRHLYVGIRGDYYNADSKSYAGSYDTYASVINPFAYTAADAYVWQVSPYATLWQSEYVRFHLEYNYTDGHAIEGTGHTVGLQMVFAAGPHKHERY